MRVLIGLLAMAALANAQNQKLTLDTAAGSTAVPPPSSGTTAAATITVYQTSVAIGNQVQVTNLASGAPAQAGTYSFSVANSVTQVIFTVLTTQYVAQLQHRWTGNGGGQAYVCDPTCCPACSVTQGPQSTALSGNYYTGFPCASFLRTYTYGSNVAGTGNGQLNPGTPASLGASGANSFSVEVFDRQSPFPDAVSYSFTITRNPPPIIGDPQIYGLQGQDFQVHGIPDEIFNLVSYPNLQVNARFVYLSSAECHDNFTACFAHPGTYIGEEGIRVGNDKIHVKAGSFKKGLTVAVNGQKVATGKHSVKLGSVNVMSHRRVVVNTPIMTLTISNSDKFLNQETTLHDQKLLALGSERRVLADGESFHSEVPLHGLQGQTWRNVEYPSGLEYEGSINDYHVVDGNLYGTDFVFNQFKL
jgi:hypothetical protein